ncbi:BMFP domain-containing protein YqiC [Paenibacillus sp. PvR018]|nr:BMFP domain-containing protein YqiC [Paenibacillus sp. PvP091]MBP1169526.1 BMFP domain-containing protein YqiC [Paenibacillus sp. PvR098]MBP2440554.1 BMFP domain-containing protein YqiC [Paenibacillus sp. PvP052]
MKSITQGQIQALDMVIREMIQEFEIQKEDLR